MGGVPLYTKVSSFHEIRISFVVAMMISVIFSPDTTPTSNNIALLCDSSISHNITAYDITISLVLDETFTPAVLEVINYFQITRIEQDSRGFIIPNGNHYFFERLTHINETTIETQYFVTLPPTQPGRQFEFHVCI